MKYVYVVVSNSGYIYGVFSEQSAAERCANIHNGRVTCEPILIF